MRRVPWQRIGLLLLVTLLVLLLWHRAFGAGTPTGPPASAGGDAWPTPLRTLFIDRCGRGSVGTCGSTTCSHTGPGTSINAPLCWLSDIWNGTAALTPGTLIKLRPGDPTAADKGVYGEVDTHLGALGSFNADSTFAPTVKGTSVCTGGTHAGWTCRAGFETTDCAGGGTCTYQPIVLQGTTEAGITATLDPTFVGGIVATGGTTC
jgi:hypothetical protein